MVIFAVKITFSRSKVYYCFTKTYAKITLLLDITKNLTNKI